MPSTSEFLSLFVFTPKSSAVPDLSKSIPSSTLISSRDVHPYLGHYPERSVILSTVECSGVSTTCSISGVHIILSLITQHPRLYRDLQFLQPAQPSPDSQIRANLHSLEGTMSTMSLSKARVVLEVSYVVHETLPTLLQPTCRIRMPFAMICCAPSCPSITQLFETS